MPRIGKSQAKTIAAVLIPSSGASGHCTLSANITPRAADKAAKNKGAGGRNNGCSTPAES